MTGNHIAKTARIALALSAIAATTLVGCKKDAEEEAGGGWGPRPTMITSGQLTTGEITEYATLAGQVRWPQRATLRAELEGPVTELALREGQPFEKGDLLVQLDLRDFQLIRDRAAAELERARRELDLKKTGTRDEVITRLKAAAQETDEQVNEVKDQLKEIEAQIAELDAAVTLEKSKLDRAQRLFDEDVRTQADLDQAVAAHTQAVARRNQTAARLAATKTRIAQLNARRAQSAASLQEAIAGPIPEDIAVSEAQVATLEVALRAAERDLEKSRITAPFDGIVLQTMVETGGYVRPGDAVIEIVSNENLEVIIEAPEELVPSLRPGVTFTAYADALPERPLACTVLTVIPEADPQTRNFRFRSRVDGAQDALLAGMFIRARVPIATAEGALLAPLDALVLNANQTTVWVVRTEGEGEGKRQVAYPIQVETGLQSAQIVQIKTADLKAGDTVVTTGGEMLALGQDGSAPLVMEPPKMGGPGGPGGGAPGGDAPADDSASDTE